MPFLLLISLGCFGSSVSLRILDPIVPQIARDLGQPIAAVTLLTSAYALPYALGQPFFGALGDALGKARIMKTCSALLAVLLAVQVLAPSLDWLMVLRVLAGLVAGGIVPVGYAIVADRVPIADRPIALSRLMLTGFIAQFVGLVGAGMIGDAFGWRAVMAATCLLVTITSLLLLVKLKPRANVVRAPMTLAGAIKLYPRLMSRPYAAICYGGAALEGMCLFGVSPFIAVLFEEQGIGGVREAGYALAGLGIGGIVFTTVLKWLLIACRGPRNMTRLGGVLSITGFAAAGLAASWPQFAGAFFIAGCGFYMTHNALVTQVTELDPNNRGAAMSLFAFSFFTGQAFGPPLFALGLHTVGTAITFATVGALLLSMSWVAARVLPLGRG